LDKETDGLMIIAKTEKWLAHFKKLFDDKSTSESNESKENVQLKKFYRATCHLTPEGKEFLENIKELPYYINETVHAKIPYTTAKMGITKILSFQNNETLKQWSTVTVDLEILTGRTHQIRYHLSHHGLPIIGDYLYGKDEGIPLQLTAYKLIFQDPNNEIITVEI
jgi:23S rRNA pseudouridine1911/1915/1917 synthase